MTIADGRATAGVDRREEIAEIRDEVCGMRFTAATAAATAQLNGRTYYFCSERCKKLFEAHPGWFVPLQRSEDASSGE